jgi:hypothetical protein
LGQVKKILKDLKKRNDRRKNSQITFFKTLIESKNSYFSVILNY